MDYITLDKFACEEYIINKSRFLGYAKPVSSAAEADAFVNEIRQKHRDATHNVYAYSVREPEYSRFSDDGEPQGTAGKPVLDAVKKNGVTDACVVVTRYFGGILLGAGGLVRAYSHSAVLALDAAGIVRMRRCGEYRLRFDYSLYEGILKLLPFHCAVADSTDFAEKVELRVSLPDENAAGFISAVTELSLGRVIPEKIGEKYGKFNI